MRKAVFITLAFLAVVAVLVVQAQGPEDKLKRPSPPGTAACNFADGNKVSIEYGRPSMRGRKIFGGLVPFGKVWRTGANEATSFSTTTDVQVNGVKVPHGDYTLYSLPGQSGWHLIVNKQTGQWGTIYDAMQDLARIPIKIEALPVPVEQFTITLATDPENGSACKLNLDWEKTRVTAAIKEEAAKK